MDRAGEELVPTETGDEMSLIREKILAAFTERAVLDKAGVQTGLEIVFPSGTVAATVDPKTGDLVWSKALASEMVDGSAEAKAERELREKGSAPAKAS
jgi:hypothetical protein